MTQMEENSQEQDFKRARTEEQKALRINQFLDAAANLYEKMGYEAVSLTLIAKELDFHRNNVYNYFNCKEDLFLFLLLRDIDEYVEDSCCTFDKMETDYGKFSREVTQIVLRHPRVPELFSLANSTMLAAASDNIIKRYRLAMFDKFKVLEHHLKATVFPKLSLKDIHTLVDYITVQAIALYPASMEYKERHHQKVFLENDLHVINFKEKFPFFLETVLRGFKPEEK